MKKFKKLAALIMAVVMVLSLSVTASAANEGVPVTGPFDVTINNTKGHEYVLYQIFTGDLSTKTNDKGETEEVLSHIKYGTDYTPDGVKAGDIVPEDVLNAADFDATAIQPTGNGTPINEDGTNDSVTIENLDAGYYLIKDVTEEGTLPEGNTISSVMFLVVGDTTITSKHTGTTIVKKIQDINDSTGEYTTTTAGTYTTDATQEETWIDSADYDINDTVPFKSTSTFEGLDNYETYKVIFTDIMAKGLTYKGDMKVYVNGTDKTSSFTIATGTYTNTKDANDAYNGGTEITVTCDDITAIEGVNNDATIVLEYSATLNANANLGAPGNPNKIKVTTKSDGTGETPWDVNIVFTYKLETNKYADQIGAGKELTGAGFTLYKWVKNATVSEDGTTATADWVKIGNEITGPELTKFEWTGIDDGKYKLVETTTPTGYNTIDPIEFTVEAAHVIVHDNPSLTSLSGTVASGEIDFGEVEFSDGDETSGIISTNVVNKSGTVLPETGGIGTTIFYALGGVMVLAAIVLLITKKRMTSAE